MSDIKKPWETHNFGVPAEPVYCEECEIEIDPRQDNSLCDSCHEHHFCECGIKLEDAAGSPGDGFCRKCG